MLFQFFSLFAQRLRLSNPWRYKIPLLIGFTYFFFLTGVVATNTAWYSFLASLCTTVGFAGFGYLTNDLADIRKDALAGKKNSTATLPRFTVILLFVLFIALAILPWFYLPFDRISLLLIGIQFGLFVIYAFPPFRLKEKGLLGVFTDSLYAHVNPAILASWTFYQLADKSYRDILYFMLILGSWQFVSGIRNILYHQLKDYENDLNSGTKTFTTGVGKITVEHALKRLFIPLEIILFILFALIIQAEIIYFLPVLGIFWLIRLFQFNQKQKESGNAIYNQFTNNFLDDFYIQWIPVLLLIGMIYQPMWITPVLLVHLIIFRSFPKSLFLGLARSFKSSPIQHKLFGFENYYKGLIAHLILLIIYTGSAAGIYFLLQSQITDFEQFFLYQRVLSIGLIFCILAHLAMLIYYRQEQTKKLFRDFIFEIVSAYNLAIFRIFFFIILMGTTYHKVFGDFAAWTHLPHSSREGLPFIGWLIDILPISPELYYVAGVTLMVCSVFILFGLFTRWAFIIYVPLALYLWGVPCFFGKISHHHMAVWVPIILVFSKCSEVFSLDYFIKKYIKKKEIITQHYSFGLPFKIIWILLAIIYCCSGFQKLWDTGLYWALSDNLIHQVQLEWVENYDTVSAIRIDHFPVLAKIGGVFIILLEIIYPLFILKPATRIFAFIGSWGLHLTANFFLHIDFSILRHTHFSYFNWHKIVHKLKGQDIPEKQLSTPPKFIHLLKKPLVFVGGLFIIINLSFGIFSISSWPFPTFPSYSDVVPENVQLIRMDVFKENETLIPIKELAKEQHFFWENIRPFEREIASLYANNQLDEIPQKLADYWLLWEANLRGIEHAVRVEMYLETTSLIPEKRDEILSSVYLGTLNLESE